MASLFFAAAAGGPSASPAQTAKGAPPKIGRIQQPFNEDGCNCTLYVRAPRPNEFGEVEVRTVFIAADLEDRAQMNIDGQDVMLRLVRQRAPARGPLRVGHRYVEEYEGEGARVRVVSTITKVCPRDEPTCETLSKSAVITVTKGGRSRAVRTAGGCSC